MQKGTQRPGLILAVLCAAAFMASLDVFIVNVAFAGIGQAFHQPSLSDLSWILNAYAIVYAALLVPLGRLADRYGRKAGFLAGLALFTLASAACAASPGLWVLVACRILQAIGAAALTPTSLGLLLTATAPDRRARAVRIWAASGALAAAAGPVLGGLLITASWQWVFLVNVPIGALALVATVAWVPDSRDTTDDALFAAESADTKVSRTPDLWGSAVLAIAIGALALGLVKGPDWGFASARVLGAFAVAVAGGVIFAVRTSRHPSPVVEPALLKVRAFAWSNATGVLFSAAFGGGLLSTILFMQDVWQYGPLRTGLAVAPGPLMVPLFAALSQRVAHRVPVGFLAGAGCLLFGLGTVIRLVSVSATPHYATAMLPGWLITGAGVGLAMPTIISAATAELPAARVATGSAVVNMSRQVGTALGVSVTVAIVSATAGATLSLAAYQHAWWAIAGVAAAGALAALGMTPPSWRPVPPRRPTDQPPLDAPVPAPQPTA